ncbi:MAG: hypothetical protein ABEK29_07535, partial [Bradymonadaceae bacterium]
MVDVHGVARGASPDVVGLNVQDTGGGANRGCTRDSPQEVEQILTDEQLQQLRKQRRKQQTQLFKRRVDQIKQQLDLTDQQEQKIDKIY